MKKFDDPSFFDTPCSLDDLPGYPDPGLSWRLFRIEDYQDELHHLLPLLSVDEKERAEKFVFDLDRKRYCICRGQLRIALSRRLGIAPQDIRFRYNEFGKPSLPENREGIYFNLSHSKHYCLLALSQGHEIGVDVEEFLPWKKMQNIVGRFFTNDEVREFEACPDERRDLALCLWWVQKEAVMKAIGRGLSLGLGGFSVRIDPATIREAYTVSVPFDNRSYRILLFRGCLEDSRGAWAMGKVVGGEIRRGRG